MFFAVYFASQQPKHMKLSYVSAVVYSLAHRPETGLGLRISGGLVFLNECGLNPLNVLVIDNVLLNLIIIGD